MPGRTSVGSCPLLSLTSRHVGHSGVTHAPKPARSALAGQAARPFGGSLVRLPDGDTVAADVTNRLHPIAARRVVSSSFAPSILNLRIISALQRQVCGGSPCAGKRRNYGFCRRVSYGWKRRMFTRRAEASRSRLRSCRRRRQRRACGGERRGEWGKQLWFGQQTPRRWGWGTPLRKTFCHPNQANGKTRARFVNRATAVAGLPAAAAARSPLAATQKQVLPKPGRAEAR
jgi:hypothetical protein